jgi:hypothetical protein
MVIDAHLLTYLIGVCHRAIEITHFHPDDGSVISFILEPHDFAPQPAAPWPPSPVLLATNRFQFFLDQRPFHGFELPSVDKLVR